MDSMTTLAGSIERIASRSPERVALWYEDRAITFGELNDKSRRVAAGLRALGINKGDCVSLWLPSVPAWLIVLLALARLGAMGLATNTRFRTLELADILLRSKAKAIVYWPAYRGVDFGDVLGSLVSSLPDLRHVIAYAEDDAIVPGLAAINNVAYADLEQTEADDRSAADAGQGDDAIVLYTTSGTTRRPKLVLHTQATVVAHARDVAPALGFDGEGTVVLQMLPFGGTYGLTQAIATLLAGSALAVHHSFDPVLACALIRKHRVRSAALTDEMVRRIFEAAPEPIPFPGLQLFVGSRAAELIELATARGFDLIGLYGSSEVQALFSRRLLSDAPVERARGGGFPVSADTQIRARDTSTGALLAHGETGEIEIRNRRTGTIGYRGDPEATAAAITADGYFKTGDLGSTDANGSFNFVSRIGDAMRLKGFLVSPTEVESCVREFAGIDLCCVVGVERDHRTVPVAFYTTTSAAHIDHQALRGFCLERMGYYKVPEHFFRVDEIPIIDSANTPKVNRKLLRQQAIEVMSTMEVNPARMHQPAR